MKKIVTAEKCVYFSQGQRLAPEHLNALNDFAHEKAALISKSVFSTSGIIQGLGSEFNIEVIDAEAMTLKINKGTAINSRGELLQLSEEKLVRLSGLAGPETTTFHIQIAPEETLDSPYTDDGIRELKGFRYRNFGNRIIVSSKLEEPNVELARIKLSNNITRIRLIEAHEPIQAPEGVVDQRHATVVRIFGANTIDFERHQRVRKTINDLRASFYEIETRFESLKNIDRLTDTLESLELEMADNVFSLQRAKLLLNRSERFLGKCLEELRSICDQIGELNEEFWNDVFNTFHQLDAFENLNECILSFQKLQTLNILLNEKILKSRTDQERRVLINQALIDIQRHHFPYAELHSFGGSLFRRSGSWNAEEIEKSADFDGEFKTFKSVQAQYEQADTKLQKGVFLSKGKLFVKLNLLDPSKDLLLLTQIYKRRGAQEFSLSINGGALKNFNLKAKDSINRYLNLGVLIDKASLVAGENILCLEIHNIDLDFGLMGIYAYQEATKEV